MKIGHCTTQQKKQNRDHRRRQTAVELAQLGGGELLRGTSCNVINLKRLLNGKQNVWKYQNGEEKSDSDGREKDV